MYLYSVIEAIKHSYLTPEEEQVENEHYSTVCGLIQLVISLECFIETTPDFLCPFMNEQ